MSAAKPKFRATPPTRTTSSLWLALAALVVLADQLSKVVVIGRFALGDRQEVTAWFNLVRAHNSGAAFSFLAGADGWQRWLFAGLALTASAVIVWLLRRHAGQRLFSFAICMVLGGAVGNLIDRLWHGHVIDFLEFHWNWLAPVFREGYFPAFNLADSAITLGAICLIADELLRVRRAG